MVLEKLMQLKPILLVLEIEDIKKKIQIIKNENKENKYNQLEKITKYEI